MIVKGVNYDVGTEMGVNWRPDYNPTTVHRELEIIKKDLHCNAVGISGKNIKRVVVTAEDALSQGLEAWLNPADWNNKSPEDTLTYITEAASAAQLLNERYPGKVVFSVGSEFTLFMQGIIEGKTFMSRARNLGNAGIKEGKHNKPLNDFLNKVVVEVRKVFDGQIMYRSLVWEQVDWSIFDIIGVDHYWAEQIKEQYGDDFYHTQRSRKHRYIYFHGDKRQKKILNSLLKYPVEPYPKGDSVRYDSGKEVRTQGLLFFG